MAQTVLNVIIYDRIWTNILWSMEPYQWKSETIWELLSKPDVIALWITAVSTAINGDELAWSINLSDISYGESVTLYDVTPQPVTKARFKAYINWQQMWVYTETVI